jgi:predicted MFS family arabinose efflux permease
MSWLVLGAIVTFVAILCLIILRNRPEDVGLVPVGGSTIESSTLTSNSSEKFRVYRESVVYHIGAIYFLFGYTYVIYATFFVTSLVQERGLSEAVAGSFWSWVGFLSLLSGPVFGTLSDKLGRKAGLITVFFIQTLSYLLIASKLPGIFLPLSIFFYGVVAWSIPSIMAALVGDYVGPTRTAEVFGFITFIFGLGQTAGPALAGVLAEATRSFSSSFFMAAGFAGLAIVLTAFLRRQNSHNVN